MSIPVRLARPGCILKLWQLADLENDHCDMFHSPDGFLGMSSLPGCIVLKTRFGLGADLECASRLESLTPGMLDSPVQRLGDIYRPTPIDPEVIPVRRSRLSGSENIYMCALLLVSLGDTGCIPCCRPTAKYTDGCILWRRVRITEGPFRTNGGLPSSPRVEKLLVGNVSKRSTSW